jgi:hypothetical protein
MGFGYYLPKGAAENKKLFSGASRRTASRLALSKLPPSKSIVC